MSGASIDDLVAAASAGRVEVYGLTAPFCAYAAAKLAAREPHGLLVIVVASSATAQQIASDIELFAQRDKDGDPAAAGPVLRIPGIDTSPYAELRPDREAQAGRMAALFRLARGGSLLSPIAVISASSLIRRVIPPAELDALTGAIETDGEIDRDATAELLARAGYSRAQVVEDPGSFAVRGGVLDVFSPLYRYPARIELFGDLVESVRLFDPHSQRTLREIRELFVHPVRETIVTTGADVRAKILAAADAARHPSKATRRVLEQIGEGEEFIGIETLTPAFHRALAPLWSYFPEKIATDGATVTTRWFVIDPDAVAEAIEDELDIAHARYTDRVSDSRLAFPPEEYYVSAEQVEAALGALTHCVQARTLELHQPEQAQPAQQAQTAQQAEPAQTAKQAQVPDPAPPGALRFAVDDNRQLRAELEHARRQQADELLKPLVRAISVWRNKDWRVAIAAGNVGRAQKLASLLDDYGVSSRVLQTAGARAEPFELDELEPGTSPTIVPRALSAGFAIPRDKIALLSADDVFGPRRRSSARQRAAARRARAALMGGAADFSQLAAGDYLVHELHGVGQYKGLAKLPATQGGPAIDFLHLEYRGGVLYLPVYRLGDVQRYVGAEGHTPRLDKLGGATWQNTRRKIAQNIKALAEELLQIYAQRAAMPGFAFPPGDSMYREFEATFPFDETPDQQRAIDEVVADMERDKPMDRLVCGDVGYGKTEVALRAIFKAVLAGKQSAFLAPTTVLVEQHYRTMRERFGAWPVEIAKLSRFQSKAEQTEVVNKLAAGKIDAVVGTHRLLSKDIRIKDLGLLIIDEEQRFGVTHKEKLKRVRTQVDVLTLTATPIPRTLHLAMSGMRDLSIIATPPADRRSIRTFIARADDSVLKEGIRRELGRGGQVFFVCPRIGGDLRTPGQKRPRRADRSLDEWAEHLTELVPDARVAVAHGQMHPRTLERAMIDFVDGKQDILISTTIVENGLDIPRANTMFIADADRFGLAQLYQLRGRVGRSRQRAFCYLLVPPLEKLSSDARRRLEALQRFTDLGAGFQIASHDLEIRGGGELLGAKQSGAIAAVGFDTYVTMLEEAIAELRGKDSPIHRARDPELNVATPGYIPDDYIPDTGQRLDLYKRLSDADTEDDVRSVLDEITDRYGNLPIEVITLGDLMILKGYARKLRATSLDLTRQKLSLSLADDTPLDAKIVLDLARDKRYRLTPDMRLHRSFTPDESREVMISARQCLMELLACAT